MEFSGFSNSDFDFFRKKATMDKMEYDEKKEEVKRHFRELCYEIQKNYHSTTGGTLLLDKNFQGLNKNKDSILAVSRIDTVDFFNLCIELCKDNISINLVCPNDDNYIKFESFKHVIANNKDIFLKFFKENKSMFILLYKRNYKKSGDNTWTEEFKFHNSELGLGNYDILLSNMEKLQPSAIDTKKLAGIHIGMKFSKADAVKIGKPLAVRLCGEVIKLLSLCEYLKIHS